jgi:asparagine synthase (glutamine-hydrolysing)
VEKAMTREELIRSISDRRLTYLPVSRLDSLLASAEAVKETNVPGDFAEFGIALGGSGICLARSLDKRRRYIGFDLFGTIPSPSERDGARSHERYKAIASGESTGIGGDTYYGYIPNLYEVVRDNFASFECPVDDRRIKLVKGLFQDTLPKNDNVKIALAHIDCDWFDPVMMCLEYVWPKLSNGGIVILDDYNDWDGCKKATDQFLTMSSGFEIITLQPHAVIKKKSGEAKRQGGLLQALRSILPNFRESL